MKYGKIIKGKFISRPNRFIAMVEIEGREEVVHVKNTGRCRELLVPGATVYLEDSENPSRKTRYDLIAVQKGDLLINMDSQAPNKIFYEWASTSGFFGNITLLKPEHTYRNSRFDCYIESSDGRKILVEVKGVTLEEGGVVKFPDAPTERGIKHLCELSEAVAEGYEAYIFFIIQMSPVHHFEPNEERHPEFAETLRNAEKSGVKIHALDCRVEAHEIEAKKFIEVRLHRTETALRT